MISFSCGFFSLLSFFFYPSFTFHCVDFGFMSALVTFMALSIVMFVSRFYHFVSIGMYVDVFEVCICIYRSLNLALSTYIFLSLSLA